MSALEDFVTWAQDHGVVLDGIKPQTIPGRGTGVIATRDLKEDQTILSVPRHLLRTLDTIPKSTLNKLPKFSDMSLHSVLAADLCIKNSYQGWDLWLAVLPTLDDFDSAPPRWPEELQVLLPSPARQILDKQLACLKRDWEIVSAAFPTPDSDGDTDGDADGNEVSLTYEKYVHAWLLINSRTFYYYTPTMEKYDSKDRLALQPVADLFNHADEGCKVEFTTKPALPPAPPSRSASGAKQPARKKQKTQKSNTTKATPKPATSAPEEESRQNVDNETSPENGEPPHPDPDDPAEGGGYRFITRRPYKAGEEVFISYGSHPNDLLLAEYGFIIPGDTNKWDEVVLDEVLTPHFNTAQREMLEEYGYWGNYVVDRTTDRPGCCWRTQVALRLLLQLVLPPGMETEMEDVGIERWEGFINGVDDERETPEAIERMEKRAEEKLKQVLGEMIALAKERRSKVEDLARKGVGKKVQREILTERWKQIEDICEVVLKKLD